MAKWNQLMPDLLTMIVKKLGIYEDFVAFGGVCRSWRSVAVKDNFHQSPSQVPWLMLAEDEENPNVRGFASLRKGGMVHRVHLPEARGKHCFSSMGWLVTADEHGNAELLHPLTWVRIPLPHPTRYKYYKSHKEGGDEWLSPKSLIRRAVLSASPSVTQDYVLMILIGSGYYPAFWKPGNSNWTVIEPESSVVCHDVIYYKDQIYAMNITGELRLCNLNSGTAPIVGQGRISAVIQPDGETYLVESGGHLLVVCRVRDLSRYDDSYWTMNFRVFKFDSGDLNKWQEIYDLGGVSIFVGQGAAKAVVPSASSGIKPNCIYFTDDYYLENYEDVSRGEDLGIYDLARKTIEPLPGIYTQLSNSCPPLWVFPSF